MFRKAVLFPMLAATVLGACDSSTEPGSARLTVLLTDAPGDYLESATVDIGRIEVIGVDGSRTTLTEDGGVFDLLELQDGVTAQLGSVELQPGTYRELRLIVESASVVLLPGYEFEGGGREMDIAVPSGASSGIKIALEQADGTDGAGVEVRPGETFLVVDFDVAGNFVMQGSADTPAGIKGFNFTPRLRAVVRDVAGSIAGTVTPVELVTDTLVVTALRDGAPAESMASASVAADGTFSFPFMAPGSYSVTLGKLVTGQTASTETVVVGESEAVTGVALTITP
jgi:hypothetical protein